MLNLLARNRAYVGFYLIKTDLEELYFCDSLQAIKEKGYKDFSK